MKQHAVDAGRRLVATGEAEQLVAGLIGVLGLVARELLPAREQRRPSCAGRGCAGCRDCVPWYIAAAAAEGER